MSEVKDMVNHPPHYKSKSGLEAIDVIKAFTEDLVGIEAVDTANVLKYICRWKHKNGVQDLEKARWYINHLIGLLNGEYVETITDEYSEVVKFATQYSKTHAYEGIVNAIRQFGFVTMYYVNSLSDYEYTYDETDKYRLVFNVSDIAFDALSANIIIKNVINIKENK